MARPATKTEQDVTLAEFLRREEVAEQKHEFHDGGVLAMSRATFAHVRVTTNIVAALSDRLRGTSCQILGSDMGIAIESTNRFVYPDATILCQVPQFHPEDRKQTTLINPRVIFELLSESTEAYDRGEKFNHYRRIPSLEEVVLLSQTTPTVEGFLRQADGTWTLASYEGWEQSAKVRCMDLELPLSDLYENVQP